MRMGENRYPGATTRVVRGDEHGVDLIIGISSSYSDGVGPPEHRHPCGEVFVVYAGRGVYTVAGLVHWIGRAAADFVYPARW